MGTILLLAAIGCGSHDDKNTDGGAAGAAGFVSGTSGTTGGGGVSGSTGTGIAGNGVSGNGGGGTGGNNPFMPNCDTSVTSVTTCGTATCADQQGSQFTCRINCCVSTNECGTRVASMDSTMSTDCMAGPKPDTRCEDIVIQGGGGGGGGGMTRTYVGCCTADNQCGGISTRRNICASRTDLMMFFQSGVPAPRACDAAPDNDAGL
ncbi:MAG TPA: hypothetical protein VHM19_01150 [Polyangiales bacterium]|nr:hypothetical protein [Polyangiales bacterium]